MDFFIEILIIFTITTKILMVFSLLIRKNKSIAVNLLAINFFLPATIIIANYLLYLKLWQLGWLVIISQSLVSAIGPLLYFYTLLLVGESIKINWKLCLTFLHCILLLLQLPIYFYFSQDDKIQYFNTAYSSPSFLMLLGSNFVSFITLLFIIISLVTVYKKEKLYYDVFSEPMKIKIRFLKELMWLLLVMGVIVSVGSAVVANEYTDCIIVPITSNIYAFYVLYQSYNNHIVFTKDEFAAYQKQLEPIIEYKEEKYIKSALSDIELEIAYDKITNYFETTQPWQQCDLKITMLSENLGYSYHKISEVINRKANVNFNEFVNNYRLKYVKNQLLDLKDNSKIEALIFDAGFNNKTSFYKIFKEKTGLTPIQFRKINV